MKGLPSFVMLLPCLEEKTERKLSEVKLPLDLTKLPIPTTWPKDGGRLLRFPCGHKNPKNGEHNLGMYRAQVFGPKEIGLHWQIHACCGPCCCGQRSRR